MLGPPIMATTLRPLLPSLPTLTTAVGILFMASAVALILQGPTRTEGPGFPLPQTAIVPPATLMHRLDGEYSRSGRPIDAPRIAIRIDQPLEIMRYQVTAADYARCVSDGACKRLDHPAKRGDVPVTGVSHVDAVDYAAWISQRTGTIWRLPTDREWAHAAGSRLVDDAKNLDSDGSNPAQRWLAEYEQMADRKVARNPLPRPIGSFGANEHGLFDVAGNVWEWTQTCLNRISLDATGRRMSETTNCGVYLVEGQHRAIMTSFIRNPKSGGCSVGTPPDNLGFRLVRETGWRESLRTRLHSLLRARDRAAS